MDPPRVNQRRSYNGDLCTVRYVGTVESTTGDWLGVEWDDPTRGKHSGEHKGVRYFTCRNKNPTAGSFVRPSRVPDRPRGFLEALREKYASEFEQALAQQKAGGGASLDTPIEISGKVVEEVGFDKIRKQLAELAELKIVLLDGLRVAGILTRDASDDELSAARTEIERTCPRIAELDLSRSLLWSWEQVLDVSSRLGRLRVLKLSGNRFGPVQEGLVFGGITELQLDDTLLSWDEISTLTYQFPALVSLSVSANQISTLSKPISNTIRSLALENNEIASLSALESLTPLTNLERLSLRGNCIDTVENKSNKSIRFSHSLKSVDLSRNNINSWSFINKLPEVFPSLETLRISNNPLYDQPVGPSAVTGLPEKPMTVDEAFMLTLSRLSSLQTLNYGTISARERNNGELYYLSLIGKELSASPESAERDILAKHPRYRELCEIHGQPIIKRAAESSASGAAVNPRSVAARLVKFAFYLAEGAGKQGDESVKIKMIPRSFDTYQMKAIVSRLFSLPPYEFRLVWETDELDPVSKEKVDDEDGWDSEDEDDGYEAGMKAPLSTADDTRFVKREVELVDSTKDIGFWFQADLVEARVRVEPK